MKVELDNVEIVMDKEIVKAKSGTSGYVYIPLKYVGRKVKICVLDEEKTKKA